VTRKLRCLCAFSCAATRSRSSIHVELRPCCLATQLVWPARTGHACFMQRCTGLRWVSPLLFAFSLVHPQVHLTCLDCCPNAPRLQTSQTSRPTVPSDRAVAFPACARVSCVRQHFDISVRGIQRSPPGVSHVWRARTRKLMGCDCTISRWTERAAAACSGTRDLPECGRRLGGIQAKSCADEDVQLGVPSVQGSHVKPEISRNRIRVATNTTSPDEMRLHRLCYPAPPQLHHQKLPSRYLSPY
jgi:hypothetical protein